MEIFNILYSQGNITRDEALDSLNRAAISAAASLPDAFDKCSTLKEKQKILADRDLIQLAYNKCLLQSLVKSGPVFKEISDELKAEADKIDVDSKNLTNAMAAVNLLAEAVKLAAALSLAFA